MVPVGICVSVAKAAEAKLAGWDFIEENVQAVLRGNDADNYWNAAEIVNKSVLPLLAANCLLPPGMKIAGLEVHMDQLTTYMTRVAQRAQKLGIKTLVFGSAGARNVRQGFDRETARWQIIAFLSMAAPILHRHDVMLVVEPLNKGESNIINSVAEAMTYVRAVNHPGCRCLVDSYHFWVENDKLEDLQAAMPWIKHVHLADAQGRVPPGESGKADYRPFFRVLKQGGYSGALSVESIGFSDVAGVGKKVLAFIKTQWQEA